MAHAELSSLVPLAQMYLDHLQRVQRQMASRSIGALLLFDPINIRYTSGFTNEQIFQSHTPSSFLFVPADGLAILHYRSDRPAPLALGTLAEIRDTIAFTCFAAGPRVEEQAKAWADEVAAHVRRYCGGEKKLAVDRIDPVGVAALQQHGIDVVHGHSLVEMARAVKSSSDVICMEQALAVAEAGMAAMHEALEPGMSENELWSILHQTNIARGGEWIETRLLTSGQRTNPWLQECGDKLIRPGELVAFDTDMIGPHGYCADLSRTFFCGPGRPTDEQRRLYRLAHEEIQYNMQLIKPGVSYREFAETSWEIPDEFIANRYPMAVHGIGMGDEYPSIAHLRDWDAIGYDGMIEANMTLCVESYMGALGGSQGVKLEEQVLVTEGGCRPLSRFPYEELLLA
jgi:Xaa-Pro aminopeptidase